MFLSHLFHSHPIPKGDAGINKGERNTACTLGIMKGIRARSLSIVYSLIRFTQCTCCVPWRGDGGLMETMYIGLIYWISEQRNKQRRKDWLLMHVIRINCIHINPVYMLYSFLLSLSIPRLWMQLIGWDMKCSCLLF